MSDLTDFLGEPIAVYTMADALARGPFALVPSPTQTGACQHHLWGEPHGLTCTRPVGHRGGHVYLDQTGSAVDDRHADGGHG
jgi:hypothetical protein